MIPLNKVQYSNCVFLVLWCTWPCMYTANLFFLTCLINHQFVWLYDYLSDRPFSQSFLFSFHLTALLLQYLTVLSPNLAENPREIEDRESKRNQRQRIQEKSNTENPREIEHRESKRNRTQRIQEKWSFLVIISSNWRKKGPTF